MSSEKDTSQKLESIVDVLDWVRSAGLEDVSEVVGHWVWITFESKPSDETRASLGSVGFHWNRKRKCWQHPCGHKCKNSPKDSSYLRWKYGARHVAHAESEEMVAA